MNRTLYIFSIVSLFFFNQTKAGNIQGHFYNCDNDTIPPTLEVINGKVYTINPPQYATILPLDLITNVGDNCVDSSNLQYKLWLGYTTTFPMFNTINELIALPDSLVLAENNLGTNQLYVVVFDELGNYTYASSYILLQCPTCGDPIIDNLISGQIITSKGEPIDSVKIELLDKPNYEIYQDGFFGFTKEIGSTYELTPQKIDNPTNGVTSFDLLLIQKHILGLESFNSPYMFLAADVDLSGTVTTFDLLTIKKVLLGKVKSFPLGDSWIFVLEDYQFTTLNPAAEDYPSSWKTPNANRDYRNIDFIGVKLGDVNVSARLSDKSH